MAISDLLKQIPSVDKLLLSNEFSDITAEFGHSQTTTAVRLILDQLRDDLKSAAKNDAASPALPSIEELANTTRMGLVNRASGSLTEVFNLTGTVLHTNLGRASLPESALDAIAKVSRGNSNLEYDLATGKRGDRDDHIESILQELTGAEAATVVNNNAAAVLICLNTLALGQEVCISRGELVEIGGSFRIPEVMERSGCQLKEVGATNRTHLKDYASAINDQTGLLMKVHTSNYEIKGFTKEVSYAELAQLAEERQLPFLADLGSGTLIDLETFGLEHEPTVQDVLSAGADVVTFSGDKLLGGPQAGIIAGKKTWIDAIKNNPLKRALRVDKMTIAALSEVLALYLNPESLSEQLPTIKYLSRQPDELKALADSVLPAFTKSLNKFADTAVVPTSSQIGSGALPLDKLPSFAIELTPCDRSDASLKRLSLVLRELPKPIIGRLQDGRMLLDVRTLDDPSELTAQLAHLPPL